MKVKLPNGIVDGSDHFNVVHLDELRGKQQNYLADKDLVVGNVGHVEKIINDMVISLETEEGLKWQGEKKKLAFMFTVTDLELILIKIRENTYGEQFYLEMECEHCGHKNKNLKLMLDKLEVSSISLEDILDVDKRTITLPKSQITAELKPLYLKDLMQILKITKDKHSELITSLSALSVKRLGEKSPVQAVDLEDLPARDVSYLGDVLDKEGDKLVLEGNVDTMVEFTCSNCSEESAGKLNVFDPDFFSPSKTSPT